MASLGFVGLGMMGSRMVQRLLAAGHHVTGYNRTKSKADWLLEHGMRWADTPRQAAASADIVFSSMADNDALLSVTGGSEGILAGLRAGKIYIDMSTVSPALIREIAVEVSAGGAHMLEAPVSGSKLTLEQGKLSIMVAGDENIFEQVKPILEAIGPTVMYIGASGEAMALKIAINISIPTQILTLIEGVLLAEKYGVPRKKAVEVMLNSAIASPAMKYRGPFIAQMPDEAWFDVDMMQKDITLALELGHHLGMPLPTTTIANDILTATRELGLADKDFAIMYRVLERMSGISE
ncbi:MAG: NAD(P)-dependent oxidoreductase [Chloroflexi bacterium]|nr:NAD(P)-dependent oxidoreductase [Chloroflexota bacterium]